MTKEISLPPLTGRRCARIVGLGGHLPERRVTNEELAARFDTSDEWIVERSGIRERRYAADGEGSAHMGALAGRAALADAGWEPEDVDFLIFATLSPEHLFPGSGFYAQAELGLSHVGVLDLRDQCAGFVYALAMADALIGCGSHHRILLLAAESQSRFFQDAAAPRDMAVLFGDGAAAVALEAAPADGEAGVLATTLHADGSNADALKLELFDLRKHPYVEEADLRAGRQFPSMDNRRVFMEAVRRMSETCRELVESAGLSLDDVDLVVPHQANLRIVEAIGLKLRLPPEKLFSNIEFRGNTTAASVPLALLEARAAGRLRSGDLVLVVAFGSGFAWGGALLRY